MSELLDKRILLIISGGIAAYKSLELIRRLRENGATVRAIMTRAAGKFVTPLSVASLTGNKVHGDLFNLTDEAEMGHIELSRAADLVVVAPATADLMARMAAGLADDLAATALLATDKPVLLAPAMNVAMWRHPATRRNLATLEADGITVIGPNDGDMACGEFGPGRMAEPGEILDAITALFAQYSDRPLAGRRMLVTAGPTHEPIDPVRYIANRSSGKQGYAIARAAIEAGAEVTLIAGPGSAPAPANATLVEVTTAREMHDAALSALPCDIAVMAAAVADWRVASQAPQKLKKTGADTALNLELTRNPDILEAVSRQGRKRPRLVIGFAAETENIARNATAKLKAKGCDWIVANDVSAETNTFGGDDNTILLIGRGDAESWPRMSKAEVAATLIERITATLKDETDANAAE